MTVELPPKPTRKELLREFFLNATLIALINELGRESTRLEAVRARVGDFRADSLGSFEGMQLSARRFS